MDLKKDYDKLYQHWLKEFEQLELSSLSQDDFKFFKKLLTEIKNLNLDNFEKLKKQLIIAYEKNIDFLFNDLLKMRELKIINSALIRKEVDLDHVIEAEKLLYQNLTATLKGYKKVKNLALTEEDLSKEQYSPFKEKKDAKDVSIKDKGIQKDDITEKQKESVDQAVIEKDIDYNYTVIRFLKKAPPLVGIDLLNYGPFEEDEIANLPYKNAIILINEKFAEKLDIS